jgi:adenylyltransferase/sulfurtransferase
MPQENSDVGLDERGLPAGYAFKDDWEITPREVAAMRRAGRDFDLIDCRQPLEWEQTRIEGATLIPLQLIAAHFEDKLAGREEREVVVYCKVGGRSLQFAQILRQNGFKNVKSMAGGIMLWNADGACRDT